MKSAINYDVIEVKTPGCYFKARYVLALMSALGTLNIYSLRNGINVAIVSMTGNEYNENFSLNNCTAKPNLTCYSENERNISFTDVHGGDFDWTIQRQTLLLGCYYYGYCLTNIPGGWMAKRFGIRLLLGVTGLVSSFLTLLMPFAAKTSFGLVVGLRIVIGFVQGVTFPSFLSGWGIWAPPLERSRLVSFTLSGVMTGTFLVYPFVGIVIDGLGWEASFYVTGCIGVIFSTIFLFIIHDSPAVHPRVSPQERAYIEMSIYGQTAPKDRSPVPWLSIAKSLPFWATVASHLADNWATVSTITMVPTYIASVHKFDIKSAAFLSALPFILRFVLMMLGSVVTDFVVTKRWARLIVMRKIMSSVPLTVAGGAMILMAFVGNQRWMAVELLCISTGILGFTTSGHITSFVDLAPRYSGILCSVSNTVASVIGFVAPQVAGALITNKNLASSWKGVFLLSAAICLFGATVYCAFASDQVQPWAKYDDVNSKNEAESSLVEEVKQEKL